MNDLRNSWVVELLVHLLVLAVGIILLLIGNTWDADPYVQSVFVNIGSGLIAVTALFLITRFFAPRGNSLPNQQPMPPTPAAVENEDSLSTSAFANELRQAEVKPDPPVISSEEKVVR